MESPRFVRTLKKSLAEMFDEADVDKSGALDYVEFGSVRNYYSNFTGFQTT